MFFIRGIIWRTACGRGLGRKYAKGKEFELLHKDYVLIKNVTVFANNSIKQIYICQQMYILQNV